MGTRAKRFAAFLAILLSSGCSTNVFVRKAGTRMFSEPDYSRTQPFFFWGLVAAGDDLFADKVCLKKDVNQVVMTYGTGDVLRGVFTLGIYSPRSVQIWCAL